MALFSRQPPKQISPKIKKLINLKLYLNNSNPDVSNIFRKKMDLVTYLWPVEVVVALGGLVARRAERRRLVNILRPNSQPHKHQQHHTKSTTHVHHAPHQHTRSKQHDGLSDRRRKVYWRALPTDPSATGRRRRRGHQPFGGALGDVDGR